MTALRQRIRRASEVGAATAEYAGVIILVAVLILSLYLAMSPGGQRIQEAVEAAICRILGGDCEAGSESAQQTEERDPAAPASCKVSSSKDSANSNVKIGFVKIGESFGFVTQEERYIDENGEENTRYSVIATDGLSLGVEGGVGAKAKAGSSDGGGLNVGASLSGEAGFTVSVGDTWNFDSEEGMQQFIDDYYAYRMQQQQLADPNAGGGYAIYLLLSDGYVDPPRAADKTTVSGKIQGSVAGKFGAGIGGDKQTGLDIGTYGKASVGTQYSRQNDNRPGHEGEFTETIAYSGSLEGGMSGFDGVGGVGGYEGAVSISYKPGPDGKPMTANVTFTQTLSGGAVRTNKAGSAVSASASGSNKQQEVTATTIAVDDSNREIVDAWLSQALYVDPQTGSAVFLIPPNVFDPSSPEPDDAFQQLLYEEGSTTITTYDVDSEGFNVGAEVALGVKVGGGFGMSREDAVPVSSQYFASPSVPGAQRQLKENELCFDD
ncbi:hypothetical protein [Actinomyces ruminicola]|uniref:Uncharacterized protein n=1 Tax=Actinomyces ruminicola TaxID=332524 RepID=A0A1G9YPL5_9ACTO|nr:hypothetical protein [Actinomyces ruminicola]SDN10433.1 hypothetical protein SAMN04487766_11371 [Actinomyces ruminicola]